MSQQTQINGSRYSFVNLSVNANGNDIAKGVFKSINYNAKQDAGIVQGNMVAIVGRTDGYGVGEGDFEMLVAEYDAFNQDLTNTITGILPTMSVYFDIIVSYSVNDIDVRTDELRGCKITGIDRSNQQGTDATTVKCTLSIARIRNNGIDAFGDPNQ
jgi:hypothetical protein